MRLPAPALACGCAACQQRLDKQFMAIVLPQFSVADVKNAELLAERETKLSDIRERIAAYTRREES